MAQFTFARVHQGNTAQVAPMQHRLEIGERAEVKRAICNDKVMIRCFLLARNSSHWGQ
jgi:hypothetical protein